MAPDNTIKGAVSAASRIDEALAFDDVLIVPGYSQVLPSGVSTLARLTRTISLNIPLIAAAMDTVTEGAMAIAMAQLGGIGVVHKNPGHRRAGRTGPPGQEVRKRYGREPADHTPRPDAGRRPGP